jgi:5'-nucleotidase
MATRPLILLTNDDGVGTPGLEAASGALEALGEVWIVAPDGERSSCSHSMTLTEPVFSRKLGRRTFSVSGTSGDAAYIAYSDILPRPPRLLVSGINRGPNLGKDTFYSGTVAAAREAGFRDHRAVAISLVRGDDYSHAARVLAQLARLLLARRTPFPRGTGPGILLNVNVPAGRPRGVAWTRLGRREYGDHVIRRKGPKNNTYYWINGGPLPSRSPRGTDVNAVRRGLVSISPLTTDLTDGLAHAKLATDFTKKVKIEI